MDSGDGSPASTGVRGLDEVLGGGVPRGSCVLVDGVPGAGKTILAVQYLRAGALRRERVLYFSFAPDVERLRRSAETHGWSLEGVRLHAGGGTTAAPQSIFPASEVELPERIGELQRVLTENAPHRLVLDLRGAAPSLRIDDSDRVHRDVHALKQRLRADRCAAVMLDDRSGANARSALDVLVDGVLSLEERVSAAGGARRRLRIRHLNGCVFRDGYHDYRIGPEGLCVFPRLSSSGQRPEGARDLISSGLPALDEMLGGGIERASAVLLLGPVAAGKSSVAMHVVGAATARGETAAVYLFDTGVSGWLRQAEAMGIPLTAQANAGRVHGRAMQGGECSPGEFAATVRQDVEAHGVRVVVIDSLNGFRASMSDEPHCMQQLRALIVYLRALGVVTLMIASLPADARSQIDRYDELGPIEDVLLLFRHYERGDELRTAISVLKARARQCSRETRDLALGNTGLTIGPLRSAGAPQ